ncbi:unnamed protein product [Closterium sp. NIES-65]|nr:unnamed protein product [Closterium sp. NIES-65]
MEVVGVGVDKMTGEDEAALISHTPLPTTACSPTPPPTAQLRGLEGKLRPVRQPHATQPHGPAVLHSSLAGPGHPPSLTDLEASEPSSGLGAAVSDLLAIQNTRIPLPTPTPPAPVVHAHEAPLMDLPLAAPILQEPFHPSPMETDLIFRPCASDADVGAPLRPTSPHPSPSPAPPITTADSSEGTATAGPTDTATSPDEVVRTPSDLVYRANGVVTTIHSECGTRQGDPLSPFLYVLTQRMALQPVLAEGDVQLWSYADDTYVLGPPSRVLHHFAEIVRHLRKLGLAVQPQKCLVYGRDFVTSREVEAFTSQGIEVARRGLIVTGVPCAPILCSLPVCGASFRQSFASDDVDQIDQSLRTALEGLPRDILSLFPPWHSCVSAAPDSLFTGVSRVLEARALESVQARHTNPLDLARLTSLQGGGAGAWLMVVPYADSLRIPEAQWQVASAFRLGLPIPQLALAGQCSYGQAIDDMTVPHHVVRCSRFGVATVIHDTVKYMLRDFASEAGFAVKVEDTTLILHLEAARARLQGLSGTGYWDSQGHRGDGSSSRVGSVERLVSRRAERGRMGWLVGERRGGSSSTGSSSSSS